MQIVSNEIALRPRFQLDIPFPRETVLEAFEKNTTKRIVVARSDDHLFIRFNRKESHFWSPQLHLEIIAEQNTSCRIFGLYGPNPTLWTFFIFLHFGLATLFIILGIWAYSSAALEKEYGLQVGAMGFLLVLWFVFYAFGRLGRRKGKPQMKELHAFFTNTLGSSVFNFTGSAAPDAELGAWI